MKLSTKSWHYWLYSILWYGERPVISCDYFRKLIGIIVISLVIISVFLSMLIGMVVIFFSPASNLATMGLAGWGITSIFTIAYITSVIKKRIKWTSSPIPSKRKPNLIVEYWKTFKGKYCPRIEWED